MRCIYAVCMVALAWSVLACKGEAKVESNTEVKNDTKIEAKIESADAGSAAKTAGALPERLKLFGSAKEAAEAIFKATVVDKAALGRVMEAAPTAEEMKALCPTFVWRDQVAPEVVKRYAEAACLYEATAEGLSAAACRAQLTELEPHTTLSAVEDAAEWGGCAAIKLHALSVGTVYCGVEGADGDEGAQAGFNVDHVVLFEHGGRWGVLFAHPGVDDAYIKAESEAVSEERFLCQQGA